MRARARRGRRSDPHLTAAPVLSDEPVNQIRNHCAAQQHARGAQHAGQQSTLIIAVTDIVGRPRSQPNL
jgi:hypothetical protein